MSRPGRPRKHDPAADQVRQAIVYSAEDDAIDLIRESGVNIPDGEARTPLIHATREGKHGIIEWLLAHGADIDHQDRNGWSALHVAVQTGNLDTVELLLRHGASVSLLDVYGNAPLWRAVFDANGSYELVRVLLSHKADAHVKNKAGRSPVDFAVEVGDDSLVTILKDG